MSEIELNKNYFSDPNASEYICLTYTWQPYPVILPPDTNDYLVTQIIDDKPVLGVAHYSCVFDEWYNGGYKVIAWLPVPAVYKGDELENGDQQM